MQDFDTAASTFRAVFLVATVAPEMRRRHGIDRSRAQIAAPRPDATPAEVRDAEHAFAWIEFHLQNAAEHDAQIARRLRANGLDLVSLLERERDTVRRYVAGGAGMGALIELLRLRAASGIAHADIATLDPGVEDVGFGAAELRLQMHAALDGAGPDRRPRFEVILRALLAEETMHETRARLAGLGVQLSTRQIERDIAQVKGLLRTALA